MPKLFLVTGGTGFLGSALVRRLLHDGHRVRVLDNNSRGRVRRIADVIDDVEHVEADIRDADAVASATRGVDCVCHLAFINGTRYFYERPDLVLDVGVKGMVNVIDACMRYGVGDLLVASSSEVYQSPPVIPTDETVPLSIPDPLNPRYSYGGGKILTELMTINYGRKHFERVVVFRPHNVYGPDMGTEHVLPRFAIRCKTLKDIHPVDPIPFPVQGDGGETRAFIFIPDFTDALMLVIEHGEHLGIYNVGTTHEITIRKAADAVAGYYGRRVELIPSSPAVGGTRRRCPDISKLERLGFTPKATFERGVAIMTQWYDEHAVELEPTGNLDEA